jgi:hypothetical protein
MNQTSSCAISTNTLHCALELSKNSWLLAIQFPEREQPSLYPIEGGNTEKLMAKLAAARDCWADEPFTLRCSAVQTCNRRRYAGFIDEYEPSRIKPLLSPLQRPSGGGHVRAILLGCPQAFF